MMTGELSFPSGDLSEDGGGTAPAVAAVDPWLAALLACPVDRGTVRADGGTLVCDICGRRYPVKDGIPAMIADDAE